MSSINKLVDKFLANPTSVRYSQLVRILEHYGFVLIKPKGGSHMKFKHSQLPTDLIIPVHNNDCKDHYKKVAKKFIDNIK